MKSNFKYHINHKIGQLPRTMTIGKIETILKEEHQISRDVFYRDRNLQLSDESTIPSGRLYVYAALFGVGADDLKNYSEPKIKPLVDRKPSELMKKVIKRTGLRK